MDTGTHRHSPGTPGPRLPSAVWQQGQAWRPPFAPEGSLDALCAGSEGACLLPHSHFLPEGRPAAPELCAGRSLLWGVPPPQGQAAKGLRTAMLGIPLKQILVTGLRRNGVTHF